MDGWYQRVSFSAWPNKHQRIPMACLWGRPFSDKLQISIMAWAFATHNYLRLSCLLQLLLSQYIKMSGNNSSYYSWACSSVVFTWSEVFWVILLKRKCFMIRIKYPIVLAILLYLWLVLRMMRHYTAYGCSNWSNKVGWENLCWHEQCALSIAFVIWRGQTPHWIFEHALLQKKYAYVSPYYWLEITTFAVDHDPNASLSCTFTWKPLNCRLNCNNCYKQRQSNPMYVDALVVIIKFYPHKT